MVVLLTFRDPEKQGMIVKEEIRERDNITVKKNNVIIFEGNLVFDGVITINLQLEKLIFRHGSNTYILSYKNENFHLGVLLYCKIAFVLHTHKTYSPFIGEVWWKLSHHFGEENINFKVEGDFRDDIGNFKHIFSFKNITIKLIFDRVGNPIIKISRGELIKKIPILLKEKRKYISEKFMKDIIQFLMEIEYQAIEKMVFQEKSLPRLILRMIFRKNIILS